MYILGIYTVKYILAKVLCIVLEVTNWQGHLSAPFYFLWQLRARTQGSRNYGLGLGQIKWICCCWDYLSLNNDPPTEKKNTRSWTLYKSIQTLSIADWSLPQWSCSLKRSVKVMSRGLKKILVRRQWGPLWTQMERWTPGPELHAILSQDRAEMCARGTTYVHNNSSPGFTWLGRGRVRPMTLKIQFFPRFPKDDWQIRTTTN